MPVDPVTSASAPLPQAKAPEKSLPTKTLNDPTFGALVNQELKAGLHPGPKMTPGDGFKSTTKESRFLPLNRAAVMGPAEAKSVDALGAATKHPLGPQKR